MKTIVLLVVVLMASVASAGNSGTLSSEQLLKPCPNGYIETASGCWLDKGNVTEWQKKGYQWVSNGQCYDVYDSGGKFKACVPPTWTSCETQLREALEAVGPYLSWRQSSHVTAEYCNERCSINRQSEALDRRERVQAQYNAALKCGK